MAGKLVVFSQEGLGEGRKEAGTHVKSMPKMVLVSLFDIVVGVCAAVGMEGIIVSH